MDTAKIIQNSWSLMLRYRALWIFGVILALTTVSFGSSLWLRDDEDGPHQTLVNWEISARDRAWIKENFGLELPRNYELKVEDLTIRMDDPSLSMQERARLLNVAILVTAGLLVLLVATLVVRYTAETALITMVNDQQNGDEEYSARKGWSVGFSTSALKLFLVDLVVFLLLLMLTPLVVLPSLLPVLIAINGSPAAISVGILLMISLSLVSLAALIVIWIAGVIALQLARRASCLEGAGVFASIWRGIHLMRTRLRGVGLTWLVIIGLELVYPILAAPVGILLAATAILVSGLLALILGTLLALVLAQTTAWSIAFIAGAVLLVLAIAAPMALLGGLREVFKSSAWTLAFREAVNLQKTGSEAISQSALPRAAAA